MNFDKLVAQGEVAREKERYEQALTCFEKAIVLAGSKKRWDVVVQTLSHKLLVYKHLFYKTGSNQFLELMRADANAALSIARSTDLPMELEKLPQLRLGDYFFIKGEYGKSLPYYELAVSLVPKSKLGERAEYLSHFGLSLVRTGRFSGLEKLREALHLIEKDRKLRPFHRLIVKSGILGRISEAMEIYHDEKAAKKAFQEAWSIAKLLETKYKMPIRRKQLEVLKKKKR